MILVRLLLIAVLIGVLLEAILRKIRESQKKNRERTLYESPGSDLKRVLTDLTRSLGHEVKVENNDVPILIDLLAERLSQRFQTLKEDGSNRVKELLNRTQSTQRNARIVCLFGIVIGFYAFLAAKPFAMVVVFLTALIYLFFRSQYLFQQTQVLKLFDQWLLHFQPSLKREPFKILRAELAKEVFKGARKK